MIKVKMELSTEQHSTVPFVGIPIMSLMGSNYGLRAQYIILLKNYSYTITNYSNYYEKLNKYV